MRTTYKLGICLALFVTACDSAPAALPQRVVSLSDRPTSPSSVTLEVSPAHALITVQEKQIFKADVTGAVDSGVVWSILEADGGSITPQGIYTPPKHWGVYHVLGASRADPTRKVTATVDVIPIIEVSPAQSTNLVTGETKSFSAVMRGTANTAVSWRVAEGSTGGTISAGGLYKAPLTPGVFHVVATSVDLPSYSSQVTVYISNTPVWGRELSGQFQMNYYTSNRTVNLLPRKSISPGDSLIAWSQADAWISNINTAGDITWQKNITGPVSAVSTYAMTPTTSGYALSGKTALGKQWVAILDSTGDVKWSKESNLGMLCGFTVLSDGGVLLLGGGRMTKFNTDGSVNWVRSVSYHFTDIVECSLGFQKLMPALDGGFYLLGNVITPRFLAKLNAQGLVEWSFSFQENARHSFALVDTEEGPFVLIESYLSNMIHIVSLTAGGGVNWIRAFMAKNTYCPTDIYGNINYNTLLGRSLTVLPNGRIIVIGTVACTYTVERFSTLTGKTETYAPYIAGWLAELSLDGSLQWDKRIEGPGLGMSKTIELSGVSSFSTGEPVISGITRDSTTLESKGVILKFGPEGNLAFNAAAGLLVKPSSVMSTPPKLTMTEMTFDFPITTATPVFVDANLYSTAGTQSVQKLTPR